jgi:hypothetical protein
MNKVYVPQVPSRYDQDIQSWVPTVNLDPAKAFGHIEILLPPEAGRMAPEVLHKILLKGMEGITEDDWLLATGDPIITAIVTTIAVHKLDGLLRLLRWDKRAKAYEPIEIQL